jgi:signal transduction histidine kinase
MMKHSLVETRERYQMGKRWLVIIIGLLIQGIFATFLLLSINEQSFSFDIANTIVVAILGVLFDIVGIMIFLRAQERATARVAYLLFFVFALICCLFNVRGFSSPLVGVIYVALTLLSSGLSTTFVCLFPYPQNASTTMQPIHRPLPPYLPLLGAFVLVLLSVPSFFLAPHVRPLLMLVFVGYNIICLFIVISILLWGLQHLEKYERQLVRMIAVGMVFFLFPLSFSLHIVQPGSVVHQSILHLLPLPLTALPIICDYALFRNQLIGTKRLLNRQIMRVLLWILLASLFILPIIITLRFLENSSIANLQGALRDYLMVGLLAVSLWLFPLLWNRVRDVGDRIFYHDFYQYNRSLSEISINMSRLQGWGQISAFVLPQLVQQLNSSNAILFIRALSQDEWRDNLSQHTESTHTWHVYQYGPGDCKVAPKTHEHLNKIADIALAHHTKLSYEPLLLEDMLVIAMYDGDIVSGFLCLEPKKNFEPYSKQDASFLATLVAQLSVLEINNRYLTQAHHDAQRLTALNHRVTTAQENERRYLALELHDDVLQQAMLMVRQLSDASTMSDVADAMPLARSVVTNLRRTCLALRPTLLDELGLAEALRWLTHQHEQISGNKAQIELECVGATHLRLPGDIELAFYRIAQESLSNAQKHAQASKILLRLRYRPDGYISLIIADNGRGSRGSHHRHLQNESLGIVGMYERMATIGGQIQLRTSPNHGFSVRATCTIPTIMCMASVQTHKRIENKEVSVMQGI